MTILLTLIALSILFSAWFLFKKPKTKFLEKAFTAVHFTLLFLLIPETLLLFNDLRITGRYTSSLLAVTFLVSGTILFGLTTSPFVKIYSGLIAIPTLLTEISLLLAPTPLLLPAIFVFLIFGPPRLREKINDRYSVEIHQRFLGPANPFYLVQHKGLLDRQIPLGNSAEYFDEASKFQIITFKENENVICKIYGQNTIDFAIDALSYQPQR